MVRALLVLTAALLLAGSVVAGEERPSTAAPEAADARDDIRLVFQLLVTGQHEKVIRAADEFFTRYPLGGETFSVLLAKAESQYRLGRTDDAIQSYERALPFVQQLHNVGQRRFAFAFFRLGMLHRRKAQYDTAIQFVEAGLTREPQNAYYQILLGELLRERGERERALKHFTTVLASPTPTLSSASSCVSRWPAWARRRPRHPG